MYASMDDLLSAGTRCRDVTLSTGHVVQIRSLLLGEARALEVGEGFHAQLLSLGLVQPAMTLDEARQWVSAAPAGDVLKIVLEIQQISGMLKETVNEAYKSFRG